MLARPIGGHGGHDLCWHLIHSFDNAFRDVPARLAGCRCGRGALQTFFHKILQPLLSANTLGLCHGVQRGFFFWGRVRIKVMVWILVAVFSRRKLAIKVRRTA